ncbi:MAG: DUF4276 family protein [Thermoguttaceae bacterium]
MHFEILVEGTSDKTALWPLMKRILGEYGQPHTWKIHPHGGKGAIPTDASQRPNPNDKTLLHNLCSKLKAYGESNAPNLAVIVLVDLDDVDDCKAFKQTLLSLLDLCVLAPTCLFRIAVEEMEAWYLGDRAAILRAYPRAKITVLDGYMQDDICGTWEKLADAVYPGGCKALTANGRRAYSCLKEKRVWAAKIPPEMDVENNLSPSFQCFRDGIRKLADQ